MSWINNEDYPKNKVYRTSSTKKLDIIEDLNVVVNQVIKSKVDDSAEHATSLLLYVNATNGYVGVYFYDIDEMVEIGQSAYLLELPELWNISLHHLDRADFFDRTVEDSIKSFSKMVFGMKLKEKFKIYLSNELGDFFES